MDKGRTVEARKQGALNRKKKREDGRRHERTENKMENEKTWRTKGKMRGKRCHQQREGNARLTERRCAHGQASFGQEGDPRCEAQLVLTLALPPFLCSPSESLPNT
jgi:hypothetical protein